MSDNDQFTVSEDIPLADYPFDHHSEGRFQKKKTSSMKKACLKAICFIAGALVLVSLAFVAGYWISWFTQEPIKNSLNGDKTSWVQSDKYDTAEKNYNSVWKIDNSERQIITSTPTLKSEGSKRTVQGAPEEIGYRQTITDPKTHKELYHIDVEYVTDIPFGTIIDENGLATDKKLRVTVTNHAKTKKLEIVPMSVSHVPSEEVVGTSQLDTLEPADSYYVQWNDKYKGIVQNASESLDRTFIWKEDTPQGKEVEIFFNEFIEYYTKALEAESHLQLTEEEQEMPEDLSRSGPLVQRSINAGNNRFIAFFQPACCWVRCRAPRPQITFVLAGRFRIYSILCLILRSIPKRCFSCTQRQEKCGNLLPTHPSVCSGHGSCIRGSCQCKTGWAGNDCNRCHSQYTGPTCSRCLPNFTGPTCKQCAPGYWGLFCAFKVRCYWKTFDDPSVCGGNGSCVSCNKCVCKRGFTGAQCNQCAPNFTGAKCDQCVKGFTGVNCNQKITCGGKPFDNPNVCSGRGTCSAQNTCQCNAGFTGNLCQTPILKCNGVPSTSPNVCSGKGQCTAQGCKCNNGFSGSDCSVKRQCNGKDFDDNSVCSGNGACSSGDGPNGNCKCFCQWNGDNCDSCINGRFDSNQGCKACLPSFTNYPKCDQCSNSKQQAPDCETCVTGRTNYPACDQCKDGYFDKNGVCTACQCDSAGSVGSTCSSNGQCECKSGFTGKKCTACATDHYKNPNGVCKPCQCNLDGTVENDDSCDSQGNCECQEGFSGSKCETKRQCGGIDFDAQGVCSGKGLCNHGTGANGVCTCNHGFGGSVCNTAICFGKLASNSNVCSGKGSCTGPDTCDCEYGYVGNKCQTKVTCDNIAFDDATVCSGRGSCVGVNTCQCDTGRVGDNCEFNTCFGLVSTDEDVCNGNGECKSVDTCKCDDGYSGPECGQARKCSGVAFFKPNVCSGKGDCVGENHCDCHEGYTGSNCDQCTTDYFRNGDVCQKCGCDAVGSVTSQCDDEGHCDCKAGYSGSKCSACSYDYYEDANGACKLCDCNTEGTNGDKSCDNDGQCNCDPRFSGLKCETKRTCEGVPFDDPNVCSGKGECTAEGCVCDDHYTGDACQTHMCFEKASTSTHVCSGHGECSAVNTCECEAGYLGNNCQDKRKCDGVGFDEDDVCSGNGACTGEGSEGTCQCEDEFSGPICQDCSHPRHVNDDCSECDSKFSSASYPECNECSNPNKIAPACDECKVGHEGDECEDCSESYFKSEGECRECECNVHGSVGTSCDSVGQCTCKAGYTGLYCSSCVEDHHPKDGDETSGKCVPCNCDTSRTVGGADSCSEDGQCKCKKSFTGLTCDQKIQCFGVDFDDENVCSGRGYCDKPNVCVCNSEFEGEDCSVPICPDGPAGPDACSGNGVCSAQSGFPLCECESGYFGETCQTPRKCHNIPFNMEENVCNGNGDCICDEDDENDCTEIGVCSCKDGWTGESCGTPVCEGGCSGHGTCTEPGVCACEEGYSGDHCEVVYTCGGVPFNEDDACGDHGVCVPDVGCDCSDGFVLDGSVCVSDSSECFGKAETDPDVCSANGDCIGPNDCSCDGLSGGSNCQIPYRWSDGGLVVEIAGLQTTPRLFVGSRLSDSNSIYAITIRIDSMNTFGVTMPHIGVLQVPPVNLAHHLGSQPNEYGYRANGNKIDSSTGSGGVPYGDSYGVGDSVQIRYNAIEKTLSFALRKGSTGAFVDQGVAYTNIPQDGQELAFALSTTSFVGGGVKFQIVDPDG